MIILPHYSKTSLCKVIMGHSDRMHAESAPLNRLCSLKQASERCSGSALVARAGGGGLVQRGSMKSHFGYPGLHRPVNLLYWFWGECKKSVGAVQLFLIHRSSTRVLAAPGPAASSGSGWHCPFFHRHGGGGAVEEEGQWVLEPC